MARSKLKHRLAASSILEVVIAMVIIITLFGIALMIFSKVTAATLSVKKIAIQAVLRQELLNVTLHSNFSDSSFRMEEINYEKKVSPYQNAPDLLLVQVLALNGNNDTLAISREVISKQ